MPFLQDLDSSENPPVFVIFLNLISFISDMVFKPYVESSFIMRYFSAKKSFPEEPLYASPAGKETLEPNYFCPTFLLFIALYQISSLPDVPHYISPTPDFLFYAWKRSLPTSGYA